MDWLSAYTVYGHFHFAYTRKCGLKVHVTFLADPRAYATVLRLSLSSVTLCIVAKRRVLQQKLDLLLTANMKSYMTIGTKMNDTDLCLEVV